MSFPSLFELKESAAIKKKVVSKKPNSLSLSLFLSHLLHLLVKKPRLLLLFVPGFTARPNISQCQRLKTRRSTNLNYIKLVGR